MELRLPRPHSEGQRRIITSTDTDVAFCGRRWGKTHIAVQRIFLSTLQTGKLHWWVGLGWKSASLKRAWRALKELTTQIWVLHGEKRADQYIRESSKELVLPHGEIWMRTAERPDSLAGEGIAGCVLDEFTLMQEKVWTEYVEGTLLDYNGWALFIGVPKGNNWGAKLWKSCENSPEGWPGPWRGDREGWNAHHYPTRSNPLLSGDRLENIRKSIPSRLYSQEYDAEVVDMSGAVFSNLEVCAVATRQEHGLSGHTYTAGLDWGKSHDYTVVSIIDTTTMEQVYQERFNDTNYVDQLAGIKSVLNRFDPRQVTAEENTLGAPLCDQLERDGIPLKRFYTTNASKREIIEALQVAFEQQYLKILNDSVLLNELMGFECTVTGHGNLRFAAPSGEDSHDDCVIALALAYHDLRYETGISF